MWSALLCRCLGEEEQRENTQRAVTAVAEEPTGFTENGNDRSIPLFDSVSSATSAEHLYHLKPKADSAILSKGASESRPKLLHSIAKSTFQEPWNALPYISALHWLSNMPCERFPAVLLHEHRQAGNIF